MRAQLLSEPGSEQFSLLRSQVPCFLPEPANPYFRKNCRDCTGLSQLAQSFLLLLAASAAFCSLIKLQLSLAFK